PELLEDARQVCLDRLLAEVQAAADLTVGEACGDEVGDLALAPAEGGEAAAARSARAAAADAHSRAAQLQARLVGDAPGAAARRLLAGRGQCGDRGIAVAGQQGTAGEELSSCGLERGAGARRLRNGA